MPVKKNLLYQTFGDLTVIAPAPSHGGHTYWLCKCLCGEEKVIQTAHLLSGATKSCGCKNNNGKAGNDNVNQYFQPCMRLCPICNRQFLNKQINRKYCYNCIPEGVPPNKRMYYKNKAIKHTLVQYKGGKCERCGYNKYEGALEFHHINPTEKDFTIASYHSQGENMLFLFQEVDKCLLLCANCHRKEHARLRGEEIMYNDYTIDYDELPPDPLIEGTPSTLRGLKEEDYYDGLDRAYEDENDSY